MSRRSREIELIPLVGPTNARVAVIPVSDGYGPTEHFLEVEVRYDDGKAIFGNASPRGYYVAVNPITRQKTPTGSMHGFTLFAGSKALIERANRFSDKSLDRVADAVKKNPDAYAALKRHVIEKNNLVLK